MRGWKQMERGGKRIVVPLSNTRNWSDVCLGPIAMFLGLTCVKHLARSWCVEGTLPRMIGLTIFMSLLRFLPLWMTKRSLAFLRGLFLGLCSKVGFLLDARLLCWWSTPTGNLSSRAVELLSFGSIGLGYKPTWFGILFLLWAFSRLVLF